MQRFGVRFEDGGDVHVVEIHMSDAEAQSDEFMAEARQALTEHAARSIGKRRGLVRVYECDGVPVEVDQPLPLDQLPTLTWFGPDPVLEEVPA